MKKCFRGTIQAAVKQVSRAVLSKREKLTRRFKYDDKSYKKILNPLLLPRVRVHGEAGAVVDLKRARILGLDGPKEVLEVGDVAGNRQPALVLEPILLRGLLQQHLEHLVLQVIGTDDEALPLAPHVHSQEALGDVGWGWAFVVVVVVIRLQRRALAEGASR